MDVFLCLGMDSVCLHEFRGGRKAQEAIFGPISDQLRGGLLSGGTETEVEGRSEPLLSRALFAAPLPDDCAAPKSKQKWPANRCCSAGARRRFA